MHIATDECFLAVGCWHPEADALGKIRELIVQKPEKWFSARDDQPFAKHWTLSGDSLTRAPRGYPAEHVALEDLKRKDFIGIAPLSPADITGTHLTKLASEHFSAAVPFMNFLCDALEVQYE